MILSIGQVELPDPYQGSPTGADMLLYPLWTELHEAVVTPDPRSVIDVVDWIRARST
jgi:hypothetical protein